MTLPFRYLKMSTMIVFVEKNNYPWRKVPNYSI